MDQRGLTDKILLYLLKAGNDKAFKGMYSHCRKPRKKRSAISIDHPTAYSQTATRNNFSNYLTSALVHKKYLQHVLPIND
jgi:hypothetical protein